MNGTMWGRRPSARKQSTPSAARSPLHCSILLHEATATMSMRLTDKCPDSVRLVRAILCGRRGRDVRPRRTPGQRMSGIRSRPADARPTRDPSQCKACERLCQATRTTTVSRAGTMPSLLVGRYRRSQFHSTLRIPDRPDLQSLSALASWWMRDCSVKRLASRLARYRTRFR